MSAAVNVSQALKAKGLPDSWAKPIMELVGRESSFDPNAKNKSSSAAGLFQFMDDTRKTYGGSKVDWNNAYNQAFYGIQYIIDRYGTPEKALQHWDKNNWY